MPAGVAAVVLGALLVGALLVCASAAASASAAGSRIRIGAMARLPHQASLAGGLPSASPMHITIGLRPRDAAGLAHMVHMVSDPRSPLFRHYISVSAFARRFGAAPQRIAAVRRTLRREGLAVGPAAANGLTIPAAGTAATMERAFSTSLQRVALAGGRAAFANTTPATLPTSIAGDVEAVVGLQDIGIPQPMDSSFAPVRRSGHTVRGHVVTGGPQPCSAATAVTASHLAYTIDSIAAAYGFSSLYAAGDGGAGQTIALYELEPLDPSDLAAYQACFHTATPFSTVNVDGGPTPIADGDQEASLDADIVAGLAPQAHVIVYAGPQSTGSLDVYSKIMSDNLAKVVSVSWVACEKFATEGGRGAVKIENNLFAEAALQGQSIIVGSGDQGSSDCADSGLGNALAVADPASQPDATAVGGTSLYTLNAKGAPAAWSPGHTLDEGVWNSGIDPANNLPYASTGGLSTLWAMPTYQSSAAAGLGVINAYSGGSPCGTTYCRETPDVSADGNPSTGYVVYANGAAGGGWGVIGGTSASAPVWGALTTLANAQSSCRGLPIGFENPSLYALAGSNYAGYFRDIATADPITMQANNDAAGANGGLYPTTAGYDMTTGLGVPGVAAVAGGLCALRAPVYTVTVASPGNRTAFIGRKYTLATHATDSGGAALTYAAAGLPAGLSIKASTGVISGTPKKVGTSTVTLTAEDFASNVAQVTFTLAVHTPPPTFTRVGLSGVARRRPQLSFTVTRAKTSPALRSVTVRLPKGLTFGRRGRGVHLTAGRSPVRFSTTLRAGALTIRFRRTQTTVAVTIGNPTIFASAALAREARRRSASKVSVGLNATDAQRFTVRTTVRLRLRA
jgi:subtilase family serine protease